jgi:hypothetical protein
MSDEELQMIPLDQLRVIERQLWKVTSQARAIYDLKADEWIRYYRVLETREMQEKIRAELAAEAIVNQIAKEP